MAGQAAVANVRTGRLGTGHSHLSGKLKAMMDSADYKIAGIVENDAEARARLRKDPRPASIRWMSEEELLKDPSIGMGVVECHAWEALPCGRKGIHARKHLHLGKPTGSDWLALS